MGSLFGRLGMMMAVSLPVYALARLLYIRKTGKKAIAWREIVMGLFFAFMTGLIGLVLRPGMVPFRWNVLEIVSERISTGKEINLVPFFTIRSFLAGGWNERAVVNVIANVLMFSPMGFAMPLLWKRWQSGLKMLLVGVAFSLGIEITQLFIERSVDIDDLMLNVAGVMLGYAAYLPVRWALQWREKQKAPLKS